MTNDYDYEAAREALREATRLTSAPQRSEAIAVVAAEASIDQAVSLALIADALERLADRLAGARPIDTEGAAEESEAPHEWQIGDVVCFYELPLNEGLIDELGFSEGDVWAYVLWGDGTAGRVWVDELLFVRHESAADDGPVEPATEVVVSGQGISTPIELTATEDPDADFAVEPDTETADVVVDDAFAKLHAKKKGGKK